MRNKLKNILFAIVIIIAIYFVTQKLIDIYYSRQSLYGINFNKYRKEWKIPLVEQSWKDSDERILFWKDTSHTHISKMIFINTNNINKEVDKIRVNKDSILLITSEYNRITKKIIKQESWYEVN